MTEYHPDPFRTREQRGSLDSGAYLGWPLSPAPDDSFTLDDFAPIRQYAPPEPPG